MESYFPFKDILQWGFFQQVLFIFEQTQSILKHVTIFFIKSESSPTFQMKPKMLSNIDCSFIICARLHKEALDGGVGFISLDYFNLQQTLNKDFIIVIIIIINICKIPLDGFFWLYFISSNSIESALLDCYLRANKHFSPTVLYILNFRF